MNPATARVSDGDRDRVVELVQQAYADGRLDQEELERRLERALTSVSLQELDLVTADLPHHDEVVKLQSIGGGLKRSGDWNVPRRLHIESAYGRVRLDLSRAVIRHTQVDIALYLAYGHATIIVPAGASANTDGVQSAWGRVSCKAPGRRRPGELHVQVTGELPYGRLLIRPART